MCGDCGNKYTIENGYRKYEDPDNQQVYEALKEIEMGEKAAEQVMDELLEPVVAIDMAEETPPPSERLQ